MDEFAGVEPAGLQELAHRLKRLHSLLAEHGPMIQRNMRRWDSTLSFAALPHLVDEALRDARDMAARAAKAHALSGHPTTAGVHEDVATGAVEDPAGEDGAAARLLYEDLVRSNGDAAYLAAFWGQACPVALQAARTLIRRAGPGLFGPESVSILRALGGSLASATRMRRGNGADARPLLPDAALDEITKHPDQWSVAMLVRYGPDGRSWDGDILAVITRAVLEAHSTGRIEPPDKAHGADRDPVAAVLRRAAENGRAARILLRDPATCPEHAALLRGAVARVSAGEELDDTGEGELEQRGGDQP